MIKLRYADEPIFTKLDEIDNKGYYCVIDTSINQVFAEQEGLSDFIGKNIEKELHIQFASCAENRIITNHQKANRKMPYMS